MRPVADSVNRAQWLRDTGNQFAHLYKLLPHDENLKDLVRAVINTEARYIAEYPYCGMSFSVLPTLFEVVQIWKSELG